MFRIMNRPPRGTGQRRHPRGRGRGLQRRPRVLRRQRPPRAPVAPPAFAPARAAPRAFSFRQPTERPVKRRRRAPPPHPFGFDLTPFIEMVNTNYGLPEHAYALKNKIVGFSDDSKPIFKHPDKKWKLLGREGLFVQTDTSGQKIYISGLHTAHTISLYRMAFNIMKQLKQQSPVCLQKSHSDEFKHVDITSAIRQRRHASTNILWLNAKHKQQTVVLKTTTSPQMQLIYIIEATIHLLVHRRAPSYVPALHFIGFDGDSLVMCSEQLHIQSVFAYLGTLRQYPQNPNILAWNMLRSFCLALRKVQRQASFTHRDCHCSNVYYDAQRKIIKFIDFDWSCIRWQGKIISVPRHLYDSSRPEYGVNRSVDVCVFLRSMGPCLQHCPVFKKKIYDPIMIRYQRESKQFLLQEIERGQFEAIHIYKMATEHKSIRSKYAHEYGVQHLKINFEYHMGYYTWECMTPDAILSLLDENKFF